MDRADETEVELGCRDRRGKVARTVDRSEMDVLVLNVDWDDDVALNACEICRPCFAKFLAEVWANQDLRWREIIRQHDVAVGVLPKEF